MSNRYHALLPFGQPRWMSGDVLPAGEVRLRRDRRGQPRLAIIDAKRDTLGRVVAVAETAEGIHVALELGGSRAEHLLADLARGEDYYLEPKFHGDELVAVSVTALESWAQAQLRPGTAPATLAPPLPPRPAVNLAPLPFIVTSPPD